MADSSLAFDEALRVLRRLRDGGFEAYFAGGCVRDLLLGQTAKDYDVATNAAPNRVRGLFKNTQAVGAAFGVILVHEGQSTIEVATFRTDLQYRDGRRPEGVKFTTAEEDAQRRDFTINGLFLDPIENRIIDFVGGQADLKARLLRAIGNADARFAEDHLRMLRAVRFASRLGFEIEPATAAAIAAHAHELIRISPERIAEELRKMLMPVTRDRAYGLLERLGLLKILTRFLNPPSRSLRYAEEPDASPHDPALRNTSETGLGRSILLACANGQPFSFGLALACIVIDLHLNSAGVFDPRIWLAAAEVKRAVNAIRQTLKISNDEGSEMTGAMAWGQLLCDEFPSVAMLKRFLQQPHAADAMILMRGVANCGLMSDRIQAVLAALEELGKTDFAPLPLMTGDDLTAAGAMPGPRFKPALNAAYDAQLEGRIHTKQQAMDLAMSKIMGVEER